MQLLSLVAFDSSYIFCLKIGIVRCIIIFVIVFVIINQIFLCVFFFLLLFEKMVAGICFWFASSASSCLRWSSSAATCLFFLKYVAWEMPTIAPVLADKASRQKFNYSAYVTPVTRSLIDQLCYLLIIFWCCRFHLPCVLAFCLLGSRMLAWLCIRHSGKLQISPTGWHLFQCWWPNHQLLITQ